MIGVQRPSLGLLQPLKEVYERVLAQQFISGKIVGLTLCVCGSRVYGIWSQMMVLQHSSVRKSLLWHLTIIQHDSVGIFSLNYTVIPSFLVSVLYVNPYFIFESIIFLIENQYITTHQMQSHCEILLLLYLCMCICM